ncbi:hypothetical protein F5146DRAFT_1008720 [Armillaria mellea]|nr:hypothetical protein F5146DRAFT_1008720 [Armillaria mellea]
MKQSSEALSLILDREMWPDIDTVLGASLTPVSSSLKKRIVPLITFERVHISNILPRTHPLPTSYSTVMFEDHAGRKYKPMGNGPGLSFEVSIHVEVRKFVSLMKSKNLKLEQRRTRRKHWRTACWTKLRVVLSFGPVLTRPTSSVLRTKFVSGIHQANTSLSYGPSMPTLTTVKIPWNQKLKMKLKMLKGKIRGYLERPGLASPPQSYLVPTPIQSTEMVDVVIVDPGSLDMD